MLKTRLAAAWTLPALAVSLLLAPAVARSFPSDLFGFRQAAQTDLETFPQWLSVLERQLRDDLRDGDCEERRINRCHMRQWLAFLGRIRSLAPREQLREVNRYVNEKNYVLDLDNYGVEDYWAIPRQHFANGGDCEDFAIAKYFSLRWLGLARDDLRIVVVQDTNLRVPHAILAVSFDGDIMVLDNQVGDVLSHHRVVHYAPVYSINESNWWIHTPPPVAASR
jgi:predicted transglutaminase-like cysteine proteinase